MKELILKLDDKYIEYIIRADYNKVAYKFIKEKYIKKTRMY